MSSLDSWAKNFEKAVNDVVAKGSKEQGSVEDIVSKLSTFFWSRFKEPRDIIGFSDTAFFTYLATSALAAASKLSGKPQQEIGKACYELGVRKNQDYGSDNILRFGTMGLIVRIGDKINRVVNLLKTKKAQVMDEKELDTLMDIFNYAVYGIMLSNNVWF